MIKFASNVKKGAGIGGSLGIPTVNLEIEKIPETLEQGIYICEVEILGKKYRGAMHYGPKSFGTDNPYKIFCEIHVFDFDKNVYDEEVVVNVLKKIRDVRQFDGQEELIKQIHSDIKETLKYFKNAK